MNTNWPTIEEQKKYWAERDKNLDRTEATCSWFDHEAIEDAQTEARLDAIHDREERHTREDIEQCYSFGDMETEAERNA